MDCNLLCLAGSIIYNIEFQDRNWYPIHPLLVHNGGTSLFQSSTATSTSTVRLITVFHFKPLTIFPTTPKLEDGTVDKMDIRFSPIFSPGSLPVSPSFLKLS